MLEPRKQDMALGFHSELAIDTQVRLLKKVVAENQDNKAVVEFAQRALDSLTKSSQSEEFPAPIAASDST
jgi:hypothetical protein